MRVLKVQCRECGSDAIIRKTNRKHRDIADVYCACTNVECGHTFVMNFTFSHTISTGALTNGNVRRLLLDMMSPEEQIKMARELLKTHSASD